MSRRDGRFNVDHANYSETFPSGAAAGGAQLDAPISLKTPHSFSVSATAAAGTEGTMTIWLSGLDPLCPEADASFYGNMVAGAHVSWP